MKRKLFDLSTMDLEKFRDILHVSSRIIHETGLPISGTRFDGGVIGFGVPSDDNEYVAYNLDNDWLFVNHALLNDSQKQVVEQTAEEFGLTIREFNEL